MTYLAVGYVRENPRNKVEEVFAGRRRQIRIVGKNKKETKSRIVGAEREQQLFRDNSDERRKGNERL